MTSCTQRPHTVSYDVTNTHISSYAFYYFFYYLQHLCHSVIALCFLRSLFLLSCRRIHCLCVCVFKNILIFWSGLLTTSPSLYALSLSSLALSVGYICVPHPLATRSTAEAPSPVADTEQVCACVCVQCLKWMGVCAKCLPSTRTHTRTHAQRQTKI